MYKYYSYLILSIFLLSSCGGGGGGGGKTKAVQERRGRGSEGEAGKPGVQEPVPATPGAAEAAAAHDAPVVGGRRGGLR